MATNKQQFGTPFTVSATGTTSATATQAGIAGKTMYITDFSASSDLAGAIFTLKQGTTTVWEGILPANTTWGQGFEQPIPGVSGGLVSITVNGTSVSKANISGFYF